MTAIHSHRALSPATRFERLLLATASHLDRLVATRVERRASRPLPRRTPLSGPALDVRARATLLAPVAHQLR